MPRSALAQPCKRIRQNSFEERLTATFDSKSGPMVVKLDEKTVVRKEVPVTFSDITPGMYVRATATKQADGTFRASRLHIFSEDQRGIGRPPSAEFGATKRARP